MKNPGGPQSMPSFSFDADLLHAAARIPSHRELNVLEPKPANVKRYRNDGSVEEDDAVCEHGGEA
jgi:hypothetical protein